MKISKINIFLGILLIMFLFFIIYKNCDNKLEGFIGYPYYPFYYSGCNEDVFGNIGCFYPPTFY